MTEQAQSFVGQQITLSAAVTEFVSPSAFRMGGEGFGGESLLVISAPAADFTELGLELVAEEVQPAEPATP